MKQHLIIFILILILSVGAVYALFTSEVDTPPIDRGDGYIDILEYDAETETALQIDDSTPPSTEAVEEEASIEALVEPLITTQTNDMSMPQVRIQTNKGPITVELYAEDAPKAVENFLTLTRDGYYDGVIFHRVISGFMIQGGDPTGTGSGGPGYKFADELDPTTESYKRGYVRGTLAMANAGPNTNGSQFFIMHKDYPLPNAYTIFGRVVDGMDVVDAIASTDVDRNDRPLEEVVMESVTVVE